MSNTVVLSFRVHKNFLKWLEYAGEGFPGGQPELLKLILARQSLTQPSINGFGSFLGHLVGGSSRQAAVGNTVVTSARLPADTAAIIKDCVAGRQQSTSEWAAVAVREWYEGFRPYYDNHKDNEGWLAEYGRIYRDKVSQLANVYAQKAGREDDKTVV
jgi:hypothetical protein